MANILSAEKRIDVLSCLVKGSGIRQTEAKTDVHRDTIGRFGFAVGAGCQRLHDALVRDLACHLVDMDEQHSWTRKRQVHTTEQDDLSVTGERWTWAAICRASRLVIAWHVGKRDAAGADALVADVRTRLSVMPQISTDGCALYEEPIGRHFGYGVDYGQMVKRFTNSGGRPGVAEKFSVASGVKFLEKRIVFGAPAIDKITTYAIERSNLTNRVWNARLIRRTLCFSKRTDRHDASIALGYVYRAFCHIPRNMKETPAMAADVTDHLWSLAELMEAALAAPEVERPEAKPLVFRQPATTARELPEGRGFLRMVGAPSAPAAVAPPPPVAPPPVPGAVAAAATTEVDPRQMDLLAWRPRPAEPAKALSPPGTQLWLFGDS